MDTDNWTSEVTMEEILNSEEVRKLLNVSKNKLTRLCKQGLPSACFGETILFTKSSLIDFIKRNEIPKPPEKKLAHPQR